MSGATVRQYILVYPKGQSRTIEVPASARVTFGPAIPFKSSKNYPGGGEYMTATAGTYALRVYENATDKSLCAVFTGVQEFRLSTVKVVGDLVVQGGRAMEDDESIAGELQKANRLVEQLAGLAETKYTYAPLPYPTPMANSTDNVTNIYPTTDGR